MFRMTLAACVALVSVVPAAPVPKNLKAKPIQMTAPRLLMIRTAVVEDEDMKLTRDEDDREPQTASLSAVTATDSRGKPLAAATLKKRLAKPVVVVVVPCPLPKRVATALSEEDTEPAEVDTGDEWRKALAADVIVVEGEAFNLNWEYGRYDLQIVPAKVEAGEVTVTALRIPFRWRTDRWVVEGNLIWRGENEKATEEFASGITTHGVVICHDKKDVPKEHKSLFRDNLPFANKDAVNHRILRIHGGIL
jgi:hypothetical protein